MKRILFTLNSSLFAALLIAAMFSACSSETPEIHYDGKSFVQFGDTLYQMPVTVEDKVFEVPVVMSAASSADRNVIVDVDLKKSNATEGWHFTIENRNIRIPAGQRKGVVKLKASYSHIDVKDSLAVTLKVIADPNDVSKLYPTSTNVQLIKVLPFNIDDYVGDMLMTCTWPYNQSSATTLLVESEKVNDSTLIVKEPFEDNRDFTLKFHTGKSNPFDRNIDMKEHVAFTDVNFGMVSMATDDKGPSYYIPQDRAFVLYLNCYLAQLGTFGNYYYVFRWISPDEAIARKNGLSTLY